MKLTVGAMAEMWLDLNVGPMTGVDVEQTELETAMADWVKRRPLRSSFL